MSAIQRRGPFWKAVPKGDAADVGCCTVKGSVVSHPPPTSPFLPFPRRDFDKSGVGRDMGSGTTGWRVLRHKPRCRNPPKLEGRSPLPRTLSLVLSVSVSTSLCSSLVPLPLHLTVSLSLSNPLFVSLFFYSDFPSTCLSFDSHFLLCVFSLSVSFFCVSTSLFISVIISLFLSPPFSVSHSLCYWPDFRLFLRPSPTGW